MTCFNLAVSLPRFFANARSFPQGERGRSFRMALPGGVNRINGWPVPNRVVWHAACLLSGPPH